MAPHPKDEGDFHADHSRRLLDFSGTKLKIFMLNFSTCPYFGKRRKDFFRRHVIVTYLSFIVYILRNIQLVVAMTIEIF